MIYHIVDLVCDDSAGPLYFHGLNLNGVCVISPRIVEMHINQSPVLRMSLDGKCTEELLGLLTQYNFADQAKKLADHEVFSVEDVDFMTEEDVQAWELPDNFNDFLTYVHSYMQIKYMPRTSSPDRERPGRDTPEPDKRAIELNILLTQLLTFG